MKLRKRRFKVSEKKEGYWPAFVDAMSAIALVFFFIMITSIGMTSIFSDDIAKNRLEIYEAIENSLKEMNISEEIMKFDREKGTIEVYSETTFELDSAELKGGGADLASGLNNVFLSLFNSSNGEKIAKNVEYVEVVGHTDFAGSTAYGRELSTQRATAFLNTMLPIDCELEKLYGNKFKASGMSEFETYGDEVDFKDVIGRDRSGYDENSEENKKARKIEIRIIFNNDELNKILGDKMKSK